MPAKGALRDRHECWAGDAMDAAIHQTNEIAADGEVVWFWRPLAGVKLATMLCIAPMTVTKRSWTPGRARRKPLKPLRGECRDAPAEPVVTTLVWFSHFHARLRVRLAPGIPCSLLFFGGTLANDPGANRAAGTWRHVSPRHCEERERRSNPDHCRREVLDCFADARNDGCLTFESETFYSAAIRSGKAADSALRSARSTPRSVISPVTNRAGVTSKA